MNQTAGRAGRPPGTTSRTEGLTTRQLDIVDFIRTTTRAQGFPPSMREIGKAVGLSSSSSVAHQVKALERAGVLQRDAHRPRIFHLVADNNQLVAHTDQLDGEAAPGAAAVRVPLLGRIAAGTPIPAEQLVEDLLTLPRQLVGEGDLYALTVRGQSMEPTLLSGDTVVVRSQPEASSGAVVAAMIDGEATVKRLRLGQGQAWLVPDNAAYAPIPGREAQILGRVVAVLRSL